MRVQADIGSEEGPQCLIEAARYAFGLDFQIDIIFNNAGFEANFPFEKCNIYNFTYMYNLNSPRTLKCNLAGLTGP